jgi:hypothetical protein|tara:strand:- start:553 stop:945 length:393 start_codon:yes stop_codon:yes gene_type:complete
MATVTTKLTITSSDLTSQTLSLAINKAITASHTTGVARTKVGQTAVHANAAVIYTADDYAAIAYVYIKNTDATATNFIYVYDATTSGNPEILKLAGGDFAFLPTNADMGLKAYGTNATSVVEFMVFGTDQ